MEFWGRMISITISRPQQSNKPSELLAIRVLGSGTWCFCGAQWKKQISLGRPLLRARCLDKPTRVTPSHLNFELANLLTCPLTLADSVPDAVTTFAQCP